MADECTANIADPCFTTHVFVLCACASVVSQLCAKLRIGKAAMVGQSVGAVFAMDCARNEELKDIFEGTTVCLVSPWVPLAARGKHERTSCATAVAVNTFYRTVRLYTEYQNIPLM